MDRSINIYIERERERYISISISSIYQARGTAADQTQIRDYAAQYAGAIAVVLDKLPRPMLLLLKTNDCLRHADRKLGAGVNSYVITLR